MDEQTNDQQTAIENETLPSNASASTSDPVEAQPEQSEGANDKRSLKKMVALIVAAIVLAAAIAVGLYFFIVRQPATPPPPEVRLTTEAPAKVLSGQAFDLKVSLANQSTQNLEDITVSFVYPDGWAYRSSEPAPADGSGHVYKTGDLLPAATEKVIVAGVIDGKIGDTKQIRAQARYKLAGYQSYYTTDTTISIQIGAPDITLSVAGPEEVFAGQENTYSITYKNVSSKIISNAVVALSLPNDFQLRQSFPTINATTVSWSLGNLAPGQEGNVRIRGIFPQASGVQKVIEASVTAQGSTDVISRSFVTTMVKPAPLVIRQTVGGNESSDTVRPGAGLRYRIEITNSGIDDLTNLIVATTLGGDMYNVASLRADDSVFNNTTITWRPSEVTELKLLRPNQTVVLEFSINLRETYDRHSNQPEVSSAPRVSSFEMSDAVLGEVSVLRIDAPSENL